MSIILHIPHSSKYIPYEYIKFFTLSKTRLDFELLKMTDHYTDELFNITNSYIHKLKFPVSRLLVDVERFEKDELEIMSKVGMGCIYEKTHNGNLLKMVKPIKNKLIRDFYKPHHENFTKIVNDKLVDYNKALVIDCHSFPKYPLPYELDQKIKRPEICIGTDTFHTSTSLKNLLSQLFSDYNFSVKFNDPFKGSIVPKKFYNKDKRVQSIMIEIRRDLYMDEKTGKKNANFNEIKNILQNVIKKIRNYLHVQ